MPCLTNMAEIFPLPLPKQYTLRVARRRRQYSLARLVEISGVSKATICRIERGDPFETTTGCQRALEAALGLAPGQLLLRKASTP